MTVRVRERNGKWQYDIEFRWPDGSKFREQRNAPVSGKSASERWAQERERFLLKQGKEASTASDVPTLAEFWPRRINRTPSRHFLSSMD